MTSAKAKNIHWNDRDLERYSRQMILSEIGPVGQCRLAESSLLVVGAGGLGSPAALYLAAAGIGRLGLIDSDAVDLSNLQRQILHATGDVERPKVESAARRLRDLNPGVRIDVHHARLDPGNAQEILGGYDFVLEGSDNLETKYLVNDWCANLKKPFCIAGILRFEGQMFFGIPGQTACYRCLFPTAPDGEAMPTCAGAGVLGPVAGVVGSLQAGEALKYLGAGKSPAAGRLVSADLWNLRFDTAEVPRDPACAACGREARNAKPGAAAPTPSPLSFGRNC